MAQFDWPLQKNSIGLKEKFELTKFILTSDRFTNGPKCREFEEEWSRWQGRKFSLFVSSGTTANTLLLDAVRELHFGKRAKLTILVPPSTGLLTSRHSSNKVTTCSFMTLTTTLTPLALNL